ncbi:hypothetical protein [Roseomonas fluvialis]|uniref:Ankyrin repeat domain-containing protein n=1 Tax=Roseomonas fluvialis TaxID=1750527 RepID=A0ABM7XXU7_9PROT|nr:hypothetical protein [Roseomonas fluvialis]BDG70317.1 hypothetical protein Rmf_02460 [Roseomonas fluvialis]
MRRILALLPLLGVVPLPGLPFGPAPAQAQFTGPPPAAPAARRAPPPALPGLAARRAPEPIPGDPNANLAPTAALFDAINRGDLAAARDAVTRGASLEERNVLGLTAVDAAVDQGRNDILFFLLAARSTARGPAPPAEASLTAAQRAARDRALQAEAARAAQAAARAQGAVGGRAAPAPSMRPRLFANDGGTPRPEAGFLGFDIGRGVAAPRAARRG